MKRRMVLLLEVLVLTISMVITPLSFSEKLNPVLISVRNGTLTVDIGQVDQIKTKIMVSKDGEKYYYDMVEPVDHFALQFGDGEYTVAVLKNISNDRYRYEYKDTILADETEHFVYLNSIQNVKWDKDDEAIQFLKTIIGSDMDDYDKVVEIHQYIAENYTYDYDLYNNLDEIDVYLPSIEKTFTIKKGICYDLTSLFAAMLRSEGIPTKLVTGYREGTDEYHAWNEVYLNGKWRTIDVTLDASLFRNKNGYTVFKNSERYTTSYEF